MKPLTHSRAGRNVRPFFLHLDAHRRVRFNFKTARHGKHIRSNFMQPGYAHVRRVLFFEYSTNCFPRFRLNRRFCNKPGGILQVNRTVCIDILCNVVYIYT